MAVVWVELEAQAGMPRWARLCCVEDDGQVFIPAGVFMSERVAVLTLGYDGTPAYVEEDHVYVPADWLAREFPADAATIGEIVTNVRRSAGH